VVGFLTRNQSEVATLRQCAKRALNLNVFNFMKQHAIKVYGQSKLYPQYKALTRFAISANSERQAGMIARKNYRKKFFGMKITHVEIGGNKRWPGFGKAV
jgi:hypothetical protein